MFGAGIILFAVLVACRQKVSINANECKNLLIIGAINGCFNFIFVYKACAYIPSGIVATMSVTTIFLSEFIMCIYEKRRPNSIILLTSITGGIGMFIMFQHNIINQNFDFVRFIIGIGLCFVANLSLSSNYIIIAINFKRNKTNPIISLCYSSLFASAFILIIGLFGGQRIIFDFNINYILSLFYLIIFASIVAYSAVYFLNTTIGPAKTGYTALVYTPSSMIVSTLFEGWTWHFTSTIGIIIILASVVLGLKSKY
jgi:drug/metabolite transporter (DMT)-like permease